VRAASLFATVSEFSADFTATWRTTVRRQFARGDAADHGALPHGLATIDGQRAARRSARTVASRAGVSWPRKRAGRDVGHGRRGDVLGASWTTAAPQRLASAAGAAFPAGCRRERQGRQGRQALVCEPYASSFHFVCPPTGRSAKRHSRVEVRGLRRAPGPIAVRSRIRQFELGGGPRENAVRRFKCARGLRPVPAVASQAARASDPEVPSRCNAACSFACLRRASLPSNRRGRHGFQPAPETP
jgi:hypothetical protein